MDVAVLGEAGGMEEVAQSGGDGVGEPDVGDDAISEERMVFAAAGAVVELVWQDDMAGGVLFLERAAGGDGDDEAYAE